MLAAALVLASDAFLSAPVLSHALGSRSIASAGKSLPGLGTKGERVRGENGATMLRAAGERDLLVIGAGVLVMCVRDILARKLCGIIFSKSFHLLLEISV